MISFQWRQTVNFSMWWPNIFFQKDNSGEISFYQLDTKIETILY